jgi:hypothetical protein
MAPKFAGKFPENSHGAEPKLDAVCPLLQVLVLPSASRFNIGMQTASSNLCAASGAATLFG